MKKNLIALLLIMGSSGLLAQKTGLEISAFGGYTFGDKFPMAYANGRVDGGGTYGGMLNFFPAENFGIGLMYTYMPTFFEIEGRPIDIPNGYVRINGNTQFLTLGGIRRFVLNNGTTSLNSSVNLGMVIYGADEPGTAINNKSDVMFAGGLNAWVDHYFTEKVGIKLMASLQIPVQFAGAGVSVGTGGVNVGMNSYSNILIFGFMGGLNVALGE